MPTCALADSRIRTTGTSTHDRGLTRRRFFGAGAAAGAGRRWRAPAVADAAQAPRRRRRPRPATSDVVVVGAGFAGLTAARDVSRRQAGPWSCSRRATASAGARCNHELGGGEVSERGAHVRRARPRTTSSRSRRRWASAPSTPTTRATTSTSTRRPALHLQRHRARPAPRRRTRRSWPTSPRVVAQLDQMSTDVPVDAPWTAAKAARVGRPDAPEVDQREQRQPAASARSCPLATRPIFGAEPRELSLLFVALLHRRVGQRDQPGHVRAQLQHARRARRCGASWAARS